MRQVGRACAAGLVAGGVFAAPAWAEGTSITIPLPDGQTVERKTADYACDGGLRLRAEYFNAPPLALATIAFDGKFVILANVLSGSGAKYAGGAYVWWTKGATANLYDLAQGEDAAPVSCRTAP